jgi:hypothetical protein
MYDIIFHTSPWQALSQSEVRRVEVAEFHQITTLSLACQS